MNNPNNHILTLAELDTLAKAYIDCKLSKLEEKELQLVLSSSLLSSPAIDEARELMGITTVMESLTAPKAPAVRPKRFAWVKWASAAACVALAVGIALRMPASDQHINDGGIAVYVDGYKLDRAEAEAKAIETQAQCMAMLESTINKVTEYQTSTLSILNLYQTEK